MCAVDESLHGYMLNLLTPLEWYCKVNSQRCKALAKLNLSILCKTIPIATKDFELSDSEVNFVFEFLSSSIYKQKSEDDVWMPYSINNSLFFCITFCLHLVSNLSNSIKLLKAGVLDCLSFLFQNYTEETVVKPALQLLAKLSALTKISAEVKENHGDMIMAIQHHMKNDAMQVDAFYCLLTMGIDAPRITGI